MVTLCRKFFGLKHELWEVSAEGEQGLKKGFQFDLGEKKVQNYLSLGCSEECWHSAMLSFSEGGIRAEGERYNSPAHRRGLWGYPACSLCAPRARAAGRERDRCLLTPPGGSLGREESFTVLCVKICPK